MLAQDKVQHQSFCCGWAGKDDDELTDANPSEDARWEVDTATCPVSIQAAILENSNLILTVVCLFGASSYRDVFQWLSLPSHPVRRVVCRFS